MLEIEVTQEPSGGWNVRYRVDGHGEGDWSEPTQVRDQDLGDALKALGDNAGALIEEGLAD